MTQKFKMYPIISIQQTSFSAGGRTLREHPATGRQTCFSKYPTDFQQNQFVPHNGEKNWFTENLHPILKVSISIILILMGSCHSKKQPNSFQEIFQPVLIIGDTSSVETSFDCPVSYGKFSWPEVKVDLLGNIYILDRIFYTVDKYSPSGKHVSQMILRRGKGPGEVVYPISMAVDNSGSIFLLDNAQMKINKYSDGKYLFSLKISKRAFNMDYLPGYGILLLNIGPLNFSENHLDSTTIFQLIDPTSGGISELGTPTPSAEKWGGYSLLTKGETIWVASGGAYEIGQYKRFHLEKIFRGFRKCIPPQILQRNGKRAVAWPAASGIGSIFVDNEHLFVTTYGEIGSYIDIFDRKSGKILASIDNFTGLFQDCDNNNNVYISYGSFIVVGKIHY